jgi:hypothetical protein
MEPPVTWRDCAAFDVDPTGPGMPGATLVGPPMVQIGEPSKTRLLAASWMVNALHRDACPLDGVMGLIPPGAHHGHLRVVTHP